jgi:hypothetical protein
VEGKEEKERMLNSNKYIFPKKPNHFPEAKAKTKKVKKTRH